MALPNLTQLERTLGRLGHMPFEDFIAALLVSEYPGARQTNAGGGGDGGIDIQLDRDDGIVVWQVKNFANPLNGSQMAQVRASIERLENHAEVEGQTIAEYNLVTIWTPNVQKMESFTTAAQALRCPSHWRGAAYVHGLIAAHPHLYDLLVHGEQHLERLVNERALLAGLAPKDPRLPGFSRAIVDAQRGLKELEDLSTEPFMLSTSHFRAKQSEAILDLVGDLDGVMHRVEQLENGVWEVQSAIPNASSGKDSRISIHTRVAKAQVEKDPDVRDWLYWGVGPAVFDAEVSIDGGPFATADWEPVRAQYSAASEVGASAPDLSMQVLDGSDKVCDVLSLRPVEATRGVVGNGRRALARSASGAVEVEFRMGSDAVPDDSRFQLDLSGGHHACDVAQELELLARIAPDAEIVFEVESQTLARAGNFSRHGNLDAPLQVAQLLCEWSKIAGDVFVMPRMSDVNAEILAELERLGRVLRRERVEEEWTSLSLTVGDPERAARSFSSERMGFVLYAATCDLSIGDYQYSIPRVITQAYSGFVAPAPEALANLKAGDILQLEPGQDPKVVWGMLVDDKGDPLHPRDWKS